MNIDLLFLTILLACSLWAVLTRSLLTSAIALAAVSLVLTILMFRLGAPIAAVFELSVCAGLITVVFVSTISLTKPITRPDLKQQTKNRIKRYWYLPVLVFFAAVVLGFYMVYPELPIPVLGAEIDFRDIMWKLRQTDILGQIVMILAGVFGVVVLLKEKVSHDGK